MGNVRAIVGVESINPEVLYENTSTNSISSFNFSAVGVQEGDEITISFDALLPSVNWGVVVDVNIHGNSGSAQFKRFEEGTSEPHTDFHTFSFTMKVNKANVTNTDIWIHDPLGDGLQVKNIQLTRRTIHDAVTSVSNYYPFGLRMNAGVYKKYRYGYQGEFAEYDEETEFNHFQLRDYDPVIGRTMVVDPYRQFASPYMWVGNNPVSHVDPTGGKCDGCPDTPEFADARASNINYSYTKSLGAFQMLAGVEVSAGMSRERAAGFRLGIYQGQSAFVNNSLTRSFGVFTAHLITGSGGWAAYGKSFAFNMVKNNGDWQKSIEGIDAAGLVFGKIPGSDIASDFVRNGFNNFVDVNGSDGVVLKVNNSQEILDAAAKTAVHTGMDALTKGQKGVLGDQIPTQVNDVIKRVLGSDGFDE